MKVIFSSLFALGCIVFALVFAFEWLKFGQTGDKKYNFLTYFPFELNQFHRSNKKSYLLAILSFFASACLITSLLFFMLLTVKVHKITASVLFIVGTLTIISFNVLRFVKLTNFKLHLVCSTVNMFFNLLLLVLYYLFFTNERIGYVFMTNVRIILMIVILIFVLFEFVLMVNKSYKDWFRLVKIEEGVYSRPKKCYLAMLEWGNFLITILSFVPLFIVLFL